MQKYFIKTMEKMVNYGKLMRPIYQKRFWEWGNYNNQYPIKYVGEYTNSLEPEIFIINNLEFKLTIRNNIGIVIKNTYMYYNFNTNNYKKIYKLYFKNHLTTKYGILAESDENGDYAVHDHEHEYTRSLEDVLTHINAFIEKQTAMILLRNL